MQEMELKNLYIDKDEKVFLNGEELQNICGYKLENSAESNEPAKLTVIMYVNVDQVGSVSRKRK